MDKIFKQKIFPGSSHFLGSLAHSCYSNLLHKTWKRLFGHAVPVGQDCVEHVECAALCRPEIDKLEVRLPNKIKKKVILILILDAETQRVALYIFIIYI